MIQDSLIAALLGPVKGNLRHFIEWREDRWPEIAKDPQVHADLSTLYFLRAVSL